ncbi:MAG: hypothetical protein AAGE01_20665 [Pseudomonadota bacterium]
MTGSSLAASVEQALRDIPETLIGAEARHQIVTVANHLPGRMHAPLFGFECALATADAAADLLVSAAGRPQGPRALREAAAALVSEFPDSSWGSVQRLADRWRNDGGLDHFWLEFDVEGPAPLLPNLFFGPGEGDAPPARGEELLALVHELGPELTGEPLDDAMTEGFTRLMDVLPEQACVFQLGAMRARPGRGIRVCINEIYFDGIPRLLAALDHPAIHEVDRICRQLQPVADACALQLDLSPQLSPDVGIEVYVAPGRPADDRRSREQGFVDWLATERLCTRAKADALMAYSGLSDVLSAPEAWPPDLVAAGSLIGRRSGFLRRIHHFKLSAGPRPPRAKAYLAVQHVWLPARAD